MKKRYLETVEDVLALKDTDTKIYKEHATWYYKFVKGVLCRFSTYNGVTYFNCTLNIEKDIYILEEEPEKEATADDVGKLCWFFNDNKESVDTRKSFVAVLWRIDNDFKYPYLDDATCIHWEHCSRLTPSEVAELTGYKVEEVK